MAESSKTKFTFAEISNLIKKKHPEDNLAGALDVISGSLMLLSPMAFGPGALPVYGLFGAKNDVIKSLNYVIDKLRTDKSDQLTRHQTLSAVYCMLAFSAFFEAVDRLLTPLLGDVDLTAADHQRLVQSALNFDKEDRLSEVDHPHVAEMAITLPHPNEVVESHSGTLKHIYECMASGLDKFLRKLAVWDNADEAKRDNIIAAIRELPGVSQEMYTGQYFSLCAKFDEFAVWAGLREHALTRQGLKELSVDVRTALQLLASPQKSVRQRPDIGFAALARAIAEAVEIDFDSTRNLQATSDGLAAAYMQTIDQPIIDDQYEGDGVSLTYPKKSQIFIPQSFRAIRHRSDNLPLENEALWHQVEVQEDIASYLMNYLSSPYSFETPLLILGQPGSGKSLLTEMLAARLSGAEFNPVRVELRDINPDSEIQDQIEEQIRADTGRDTNWAEYVTHCEGRAPLVILDGYDELLQASGKVFSTYLMSVARFQNREATQGRRVRVIVTSRITLVDKAMVPPGAIIVRLEEFDDTRRSGWIDIWNDANKNYYHMRGVEPFRLPRVDEIIDLAQQPLLLLMLALYDSDDNRLASTRHLSQTYLYYTLLRRFIHREHMKGEAGREFRALDFADKEALVDVELRRLKVAAVGMLNRRAVHISKTDLDGDLLYYSMSRVIESGAGLSLGQAELLLGSFFFVHESRSRVRSDPDTPHAGPAAFEFLHNTFGEFLAADWILDIVLEEACLLVKAQTDQAFKVIYEQRLASKNGLSKSWFSTLMATPLFGRPVVLRMMREWSDHRLGRLTLSVDNFVSAFEPILYSQVARFLDDRSLPDMILGNEDTPYVKKSVLTNIATYILNLVIVRCVIGGEWRVDQQALSKSDDVKPWPQIISAWHAGLGVEELKGVSAILESTVDAEGDVHIRARGNFSALESPNALVDSYRTAAAVGDQPMMALTGWALQDSHPDTSVVNIEQLAAIPWLRSSGPLFDEVVSRAQLREIASIGFANVDKWESEVGRGTATDVSLSRLRVPYRRGSGSSQTFYTYVYGHAELSLNFDPVVFQDRADDYDVDLANFIVLKRPILAANLIAWLRERRLADVDVEAEDPTSIRPQRSIVEDSLALHVLEVAADLCRQRKTEVAPEVQIEVLLSVREPGGFVDVLGFDCPVWSIASRPPSTIAALIELSRETGFNDWVLRFVDLFANEEPARGPDLVLRLGGLSALRTLAYAGELVDVGYMDVDVAQRRARLSGILLWTVERTEPEDWVEALRVFVGMMRNSPDNWLRVVGADDRRLLDYFRSAVMELSLEVPREEIERLAGLIRAESERGVPSSRRSRHSR